jgi:hypothetical protein
MTAASISAGLSQGEVAMSWSDFIVRNIEGRLGYRFSTGIEKFAGNLADVPDAERQRTDLHRFFYENDGTIIHKWRHYLDIYDRHLAAYRSRAIAGPPLRLLEIGVSEGGSLRLWRRYFGDKAIIFGIDVNPKCAAFDGREGRVRIGSQDDPAFLESVVAEMGGLDVVIDDGSHAASHQKSSFETLFPRLSAHGIYICEDLHTSYWPGTYGGGYRRSSAFIEFSKRIIDDIHADYHHHEQGVQNAKRLIHGIHFYNSMVVIEKKPQEPPMHVRSGNPQV